MCLVKEEITMLKEFLAEYNIPGFPAENTREECLRLMQEHVYGYLPEKPVSLTWEDDWTPNYCFCAGKADLKRVKLTATLAGGKEFSFPVYVSMPIGEKDKKYPFFVMINFRPDVPDRYLPVEEIIDSGFAVLSFCYNDVTMDNNDFTDGLAGVLYENGERGNTDAGKLMMWAWAAMRVMDYAEGALSDKLDLKNAAVTGHSRLGKTSIITAAFDERFGFCFANDSGCAGDALERNHQSYDGCAGRSITRPETIADITKNFPFWFCKNYYQYAGNETAMPCDQHFLVVGVYPRHMYHAAAQEDYWADQINQYMCAYAVGQYYEANGKTGFVCPDRLPMVGERFASGNIGYHLRPGMHYFSRTDWLYYIDYFKQHLEK